jgi:hypothetical protein
MGHFELRCLWSTLHPPSGFAHPISALDLREARIGAPLDIGFDFDFGINAATGTLFVPIAHGINGLRGAAGPIGAHRCR